MATTASPATGPAASCPNRCSTSPPVAGRATCLNSFRLDHGEDLPCFERLVDLGGTLDKDAAHWRRKINRRGGGANLQQPIPLDGTLSSVGMPGAGGDGCAGKLKVRQAEFEASVHVALASLFRSYGPGHGNLTPLIGAQFLRQHRPYQVM